MTIEVGTPGTSTLGDAVAALRAWQDDGAPVQLHPGDVGWFWRFGADRTSAAVRTWHRNGRMLAVGLLDGPAVLRLTIEPDAWQDEDVARRLANDVAEPGRGVLPAGRVSIEAPPGAVLNDVLAEDGWTADERWTPLRRDLGSPVPDPGVRTELVGPEQASVRAAVHRASFQRSTFGVEHWHAMADGSPYATARCLLAYDDRGDAVAAVTAWSAGPGKPGLIEPMGVHRDHGVHGFGTAITLAAAAALRELGSSSALVCTPTSNVGAVATYLAAGFVPGPERRDHCRRAVDPLPDRDTRPT